MAWWLAIPAVISAVSSLSNASSAGAQNSNQQAWNEYNAFEQNRIDLANLHTQNILGAFNASMALSAGDTEAEAIDQSVIYNTAVVEATTEYNNSLLDEDLSLLWEQAGLDQTLLAQQRMRERGGMVALQSVSGTVIGEGSNADVVVNQKTQEALDAFIIERGADVQAHKIANAQAKNSWEGEMQIQRLQWEGEMGSYLARTNAQTQALSIMGQTRISTMSGAQTAGYRFMSNAAGAQLTASQNSTQIRNNLNSGLFSAAGQAASAYYQSAAPNTSAQNSQTFASNSISQGYNTNYTPTVAPSQSSSLLVA